MSDRLSQPDWDRLLEKIKLERCTPFLGPDAYSEFIPLSVRIAQEWSNHPEFPFLDHNSLPLAAQALNVIIEDETVARDRFVEQFEKLWVTPRFDDPYEPHMVLAGLPFQVFITTNFDNFMMEALVKKHKSPMREVCRWNRHIQPEEPTVFETGYKPTVANPAIFHLYGYCHQYIGEDKIACPESLVLTEDDFLDFLVNTARDPSLIPLRIQKAFTGTALMLLGYRLDDWSFRVLFRCIASYLNLNQNAHVAVQLMDAPDEQKQKAQSYFNRYLARNKFRIYWGTCQEFVVELKKKWKDAGYD